MRMYRGDVDELEERRTLDDVMADLLGKPPSHRCTARNRSGEQCSNGPVPGSTVCRNHGGLAPTSLGKAEQRNAERQSIMNARKSVLELTDAELIETYGNPGETLQWTIALSRALAARLMAEVADYPALTYYDGFGVLRVRGEVGAMLKAADMAGSHAERALRLNLDRRGLDLQERQIALLDRALDTALAQAGITSDAQRIIRTVLRAEILAADGVETVEMVPQER